MGVLLFVAPWPASLVEVAYSRGMYRWIQAFLTTVSNLTPWTWLDVIIGIALALTVWRSVRLAREAQGRWGAAALEGVRRLARAGGYTLIAFTLCWGLNYRRSPLLAVALPQPVLSVDELRQLAVDAATLAARTRPAAQRQLLGYRDVARVLPPLFNRALERLGEPSLVVPGRPKFTLLTPFFTRAGVNGMVDPFALESLVHPDLLPFERPFVLAHEWGHLAGFADEAEASAIGWSACMLGDDPLVYSAAMFLLVETAAALPPRVWREVLTGVDDGVRSDLRALAARWALITPAVQAASSTVYDQYLKANRVEDGVRSYSRAVQLILQPILRDQLNGLRSGRVDPIRQP